MKISTGDTSHQGDGGLVQCEWRYADHAKACAANRLVHGAVGMSADSMPLD